MQEDNPHSKASANGQPGLLNLSTQGQIAIGLLLFEEEKVMARESFIRHYGDAKEFERSWQEDSREFLIYTANRIRTALLPTLKITPH